jgi:hypothetical protein
MGYVETSTGNWAKLGFLPPVKGEPEIVHVEPDLNITKSTDESKLNKTEQAYLAMLRAKNYAYLGIQNITLKLGDDLRLTMDFNFINEQGRFVFVDTKGGFWREDAKIKVKVAARMYRWATFIVAHKEKSGWTEEIIKP